MGGLTAFGLGMGDYLQSQRVWATENEPLRKAKSCILIWLDGGPSHLETFDPKPEAPLEVRGPLQTIATTIPGVRFSECLPKTAAAMNQIAIVRSMTSPLGEHNFGTHYLMTGYKPTPVLEYPAYGAVVSQLYNGSGVLPSNIAIPNFRVGGSLLTGGGYLPAATRPFAVGGDPARPDFAVRDLDFFQGLNLTRLDRRRQFVAALNAFEENKSRNRNQLSDPDLERAFQLIASEDAKRAFRLEEEPESLRQKYGGKSIGQSCLLARRLVERGVPFVTVNNRGWDTHEQLQVRLKDGFAGAKVGVGLIPSLDHALSALIWDLDNFSPVAYKQ